MLFYLKHEMGELHGSFLVRVTFMVALTDWFVTEILYHTFFISSYWSAGGSGYFIDIGLKSQCFT